MSKWQKPVKTRTIKSTVYNSKTRKMEQRVITVTEAPIRKMISVIAAIALELAGLIYLYIYFLSFFSWFIYVAMGLSVLCCFRVLVGSKNPSSKTAWVMFLLLCAPIAFAVYIVWGELTSAPHKIRKSKRIAEKSKSIAVSEATPELPPRIKGDCEFLSKTAGVFPLRDQGSHYFPMGAPLFDDILSRLKSAQKYIFIEFFIISEGKLLDRVLDILEERAAAGVDVRIIYDALGSQEISLYTIKQIKKAGIKILPFERVYPLLDFFITYRDHRKIVVIDGLTAYTGGANLADEYINEREKHVHWKDAGIRTDGFSAKSFALMFLRMWEYASKEKIDYADFLQLEGIEENSEKAAQSIVVPYSDAPFNKAAVGKNMYANLIANSRKYVWIMSPYFIVDDAMVDIIKNKALTGVDVRIMIPGVPDKKMVYIQTVSNLEKLVPYGVRLYKYSKGFLHSKVMLSDDECGIVSTVNFDFRSFHQQNECGLYLNNPVTLSEIKADFENSFAECEEATIAAIKKRSVFTRMFLAFLKLFAPLM